MKDEKIDWYRYKQIVILTDRHIDKQIERKKETYTDCNKDKPIKGQINRKTYRKIDRQNTVTIILLCLFVYPSNCLYNYISVHLTVYITI